MSPTLRRYGAPAAILVLAALLTGCVLGPDYHRPAVDAPASFRGAAEANPGTLADLPWWAVFKDETLQALIREALTNNYDVRIAVARVEQARAISVQTHAGFYPQVGYEADATRGRNTSLGKAVINQGRTQSTFLGALEAAWEIDLWGRLRRLDEAARAQYLASEEAHRGVALVLVSATAQSYFELLELDRLLEIAQRSATSFDQSLTLFRQRLAGGIASKLETARAEAALASTAAVIPDLQRRITLKENELSVLLGRNPGAISRGPSLLQQPVMPEIPAGVPSTLLERRPDLREAEQALRSANAGIGAALGDLLPRISLTALAGGISADLSALTATGARTWSVGATVAGPLFQGNRLVGRYRQAEAARDEAELRYRQAALRAFQEVSDALTSRAQFEAMRVRQAQAVEAYREAVMVSVQRYTAGRASYFEVLEAQQQLLPAENALAEIQLNQQLTVVTLYRALGGGWATGEAPDNPSEPRPGLPARSDYERKQP